jgi:hypothetical protein
VPIRLAGLAVSVAVLLAARERIHHFVSGGAVKVTVFVKSQIVRY